MVEATQLFALLILAILGIIAPLITLFLSIYREGSLHLIAEYQSDIISAEDSLKELTQSDRIDETKIEKGVKELKKTKKTLKNKLSLLDAKVQSILLFLPPLISFAILLLTYFINSNIKYWLLGISFILFIYAIYNCWMLIKVIIEVKEPVDLKRSENIQRTIDLLSQLVSKTTDYFLKDVVLKVNNKKIDSDDVEFSIKLNQQSEYSMKFINSELKMAKFIEIGLEFPVSFRIDHSGSYKLYTSDDKQIVRWNRDQVQGHTTQILPSLTITPEAGGDFPIRSWIKAENIASVYKNFKISVG